MTVGYIRNQKELRFIVHRSDGNPNELGYILLTMVESLRKRNELGFIVIRTVGSRRKRKKLGFIVHLTVESLNNGTNSHSWFSR